MPAAVQRATSAAASEISGSGSTGSRVVWPAAPSSAVRSTRSRIAARRQQLCRRRAVRPRWSRGRLVSRSSATTAACASLLVVGCRLAAVGGPLA